MTNGHHFRGDNELSREDWCGLLALADDEKLCTLIDEILSSSGAFGDVQLLRQVQTGTAQLIVREPVVEERFIIGDSLVTVAEVSFRGTMGWAMRTGSNHHAAVSAAVADAILTSSIRELQDTLLEFLQDVSKSVERERQREWAMVSATAIEFEELD